MQIFSIDQAVWQGRSRFVDLGVFPNNRRTGRNQADSLASVMLKSNMFAVDEIGIEDSEDFPHDNCDFFLLDNLSTKSM